MNATPLELFAAFISSIPLLSREDLEATLEMLRGNPGYERALEHARIQAAELGIDVTNATPNELPFETREARPEYASLSAIIHS